MNCAAMGIFFLRFVPLMNAVLRAVDAARAADGRDLESRQTSEFLQRGGDGVVECRSPAPSAEVRISAVRPVRADTEGAPVTAVRARG